MGPASPGSGAAGSGGAAVVAGSAVVQVLAARGDSGSRWTRAIPAVIERAIEIGRVLRIGYLDRFGAHTEREVEPFALVHGVNGWYL
ncbi:WYL domain-containing protein, partial [Nocardia asiatica]|uniref:WYL domain-containing protein n=1 Tax=Nocardia asiatica TaxID=209252 RepID=UPI00313E4301